MVNSTEKPSLQKLIEPIRGLLFFVFFFLYLWFRVDLRLIYHTGGIITNFPVFYKDWEVFYEYLSYPGGTVEYLTAFLAQFYYFGWIGALITTLVAWLIFVCTDTIIKTVKASYLRFIRFIGPILLLTVYTGYTYYFDTAISLSVGLVFVLLYLKITEKCERFSLIVFLILSLISYYLGGKSYSIFAILCWICERLFRRGGKLGLLYLLMAIAVPFLVEGQILSLGAHDTFLKHLPAPFSLKNQMVITVYIFYSFIPLSLIGLRLYQPFIPQKTFVNNLHNNTPGAIKVIMLEVAKTTVLLLSIVLSVSWAYDREKTLILKADYYACKRMWPEVIRIARTFPTSIPIIHMADRALYHAGRLGYDMFSFPQHLDFLFLSSEKYKELETIEATPGHWKRFGLYMDLGRVNHAQHNLTDCLEMFGELPILLKNLALINLAKGNYNSARVYLGSLSKTVFHSDWAEKYTEKLKSDPTLQKDPEVNRLRSVMQTKNYDFNTQMMDKIFLDLLESNRQNRMAFEYMMTTFLLTRKLDDFTQNLYRIKDLKYPEIPRLYEEAILLYRDKTKKPVNLHGFHISQESLQRYRNFVSTIESNGGDLKAAYNDLAKNYRDSYMFYCIYGRLKKK